MWAVAIALNLALVYGMYPHHQDNGGLIDPPQINSLYGATLKTVWGLILAWISYACLTGWGGKICPFSTVLLIIHAVIIIDLSHLIDYLQNNQTYQVAYTSNILTFIST